MMYTIWTAGGQEYHLRLTTKATVDLEKRLGKSPLEVFAAAANGHFPTLSDLAATLHAALQPLHHGITEARTYELMDAWFEDGHNMLDLIPVILEVFRHSGLVAQEQETTEKN